MSTLSMAIIILIATIIAFLIGKIPFSIISTGIILSLIMTNILPANKALEGFINPNVVMFVAMFVIGAGLTKTSILSKVQDLVIKYKHNPKMLILISSAVAGLLSILTSATATAAIMLPLLVNVAKDINISRSKILFPAMIVANIATGLTFLGQGASNMTFSDIMMNSGGTTPFTIWSFTIAKLPFVLVSLIYACTFCWKLTPDIPNESFNDSFTQKKSETLSEKKEKIAISIIILTIISMLFANQLKLPMFVLASLGACFLVLTGVLNEKEALASIHGPTIFLFAGVLALSDAIKITGAGNVVADKMILVLGNTTNPYLIMAVFFIVPLFLTQIMSNIATIMIFVPLVCAAATKIGVDPRALVMGVLIAGSISILTPMAAPAQTIIMGPGGYKLKDYLRAGLPLVIVLTIMVIFILPIMFPFYS
ncbi:MAG: SLC13 family permease [Cetobacterium sp.]|uniref:SLC13 family permease n=1 Tax=Cetobacterium sp. TaxID=2071632 RepID=UPI003F2DE686